MEHVLGSTFPHALNTQTHRFMNRKGGIKKRERRKKRYPTPEIRWQDWPVPELTALYRELTFRIMLSWIWYHSLSVLHLQKWYNHISPKLTFVLWSCFFNGVTRFIIHNLNVFNWMTEHYFITKFETQNNTFCLKSKSLHIKLYHCTRLEDDKDINMTM